MANNKFCCAKFVIPALICLVGWLTVAGQTAAPVATPAAHRDEKVWQTALKLQRSALVVDGHNDITSYMLDNDYDLAQPSVGKYHTDLNRMLQSGLTAEFFSIYVDKKYAVSGGSTRRALDMIDRVFRAAEQHPDKLLLASSVADIKLAKKQGKIAALMGIEGGHAIEDSLDALRVFYRLGVRYMTLTHNNTNNWADSARDVPTHNGLTDFGKDVVREMNRLGMFVDVSHVSDKTMSDVLDISTAPIIASHSSCRALCNHPRNIPDDLLRRIGKNGGVVMINFYTSFIDPASLAAETARAAKLRVQLELLDQQFKLDPTRLEAETNKLFSNYPLPDTPISILIDHIEHVIQVAGIDHVGLGSDFDGGVTLPKEMKGVEDLPLITYELLKRGHAQSDVRKILGGNFMRAFAQVEAVARLSTRQISGGGSLKRISK